jgi:hypothetical protein
LLVLGVRDLGDVVSLDERQYQNPDRLSPLSWSLAIAEVQNV